MADHGADFLVHQPLGDLGGNLRVCLIVFRDNLKLDLFAVNDDVLGIQVVGCQLDAGLVVLAKVGDVAGQRSNAGDLDDFFSRCAGLGSRLGFGFLPAGSKGGDGSGDETEARELHECFPLCSLKLCDASKVLHESCQLTQLTV